MGALPSARKVAVITLTTRRQRPGLRHAARISAASSVRWPTRRWAIVVTGAGKAFSAAPTSRSSAAQAVAEPNLLSLIPSSSWPASVSPQ